jgi:malonyl-CoA O-methyltransferase
MLSPSIEIPPRQRVSSAFGRKAAAYDAHAAVQGELAALLAEKILSLGVRDARWADLGCGTGVFADACDKSGIHSRFVGVDISIKPLIVYNKKNMRCSSTVQGDICRLPFKKGAFDAAVTASTLQWLDDAPEALKQIAAILIDGGRMAFSVFLQGSFRELHSVQKQFGIPSPVRCLETGAFVRSLRNAGFRNVDFETVEKTVHAPTAAMVLKSISAIGGTATAAVRLLNRKELAGFCDAYEKGFRDSCGVPLTYRAAVGVCRKGHHQ